MGLSSTLEPVAAPSISLKSGSGVTSGRLGFSPMPIKLPKGFARRKSSSNALEEVQNPTQSSFRVFERPTGDKKSFSDGNLVAKRLSEGQPLDSPSEDDNNIFALHNSQPARHQYEPPLSPDEYLTPFAHPGKEWLS